MKSSKVCIMMQPSALLPLNVWVAGHTTYLVMALAPLDVEATIAPSVVAIGHRIISLCT